MGFAQSINETSSIIKSELKNMWSPLYSSKAGKTFGRGMGRAVGFEYKAGKNMGFMGRNTKPGIFGAGKFAFGMKVLGPAWLGMSIYQGFQEGGVLGAAKSGLTDLAMMGAMEVGASAIMNPITIGLAAVGAASYGYYKLGQASKVHRKRLRNLEMGGDLVDNFGTMNTMRQRSLSAIQNTHMSGRLALGNEALLMTSSLR